MTPTAKPRWARAAARLAVMEDLPTPPLPEATASTRAPSGTALGPAEPWAFLRAMPIAVAFCSGVISVQSMPTEVTPGRPLARLTISRLSWARQRASGSGEGEGDADGTVGVDGGGLGHPELDDVGPELGVDDPAEGLEDVVRGGDSVHGEDSNGVARVNSAGWKVRRRSAIPTSGIRGSRQRSARLRALPTARRASTC